MRNLFNLDMNIDRLVAGIELHVGKKINPSKTLLIFDEIQEVPNALTSLKYFYEERNDYFIVCAGSLLGVAMHSGISFPVGKVSFMTLYPLSFEEFLIASNKGQYKELIDKGEYHLLTAFKEELIELLKQYYYIGGMPEVVSSYLDENDYNLVRELQKDILKAYEYDFSKHAPTQAVPRIRMVWNSIASQLSKENKKFVYGLVKEGGRAKDFEIAIQWLEDCGLIYKIYRANTPKIPLSSYKDLKAFKLYVLDIGLLGCMVRLNKNSLLEGNSLFIEFKGALTEQYTLQQLVSQENIDTYYWTNKRGTAEVDFLLDNGEQIIPVEVKAETNLKSKSLKTFVDKYDSDIAIRTSMADYKLDGWVTNLPLYLAPYNNHI